MLAEKARLQRELSTWETELSAVMPLDFKDWHQNVKSEWPKIAASVITSLRERETFAFAAMERAQLASLME